MGVVGASGRGPTACPAPIPPTQSTHTIKSAAGGRGQGRASERAAAEFLKSPPSQLLADSTRPPALPPFPPD